MNYSSLYASVMDYTARDDISQTVFDTWLRLVEGILNARLDASHGYEAFESVLTAGAVDLPDDFKRGILVRAGQRVLEYQQPQMFEANRYIPGWFTIKGKKLFVSGNIGNIPIRIEYEGKIRPLTADIPENEITKNYPDLYLFGALKEACLWMKDAEGMAANETRFVSGIEEANLTSSTDAMSGSQLVARPDMSYIGGQ